MKKAIIVITAILISCSAARAFMSGCPLFFSFGWHGRITEEALEPMGYSQRAINQIKRGNRHQDWDITPIRILDTRRHFCRDQNQSHDEAFARNKAYLESLRLDFISMMVDTDPDIPEARRVLGYCLHTAQDAFSHSNYCHMSEDDQEQYLASITHPDAEPSSGTILVCSGPDSRDSLAYGHDDHHKDNEASPEGEEAFWTARDGAVLATRDFISTTRKMIEEIMGEESTDELWSELIDN